MALPIIMQNLLSAAVNSADTLMLSFTGQNEMAAVALANQIPFVLNLFYMGLTSGTGIMMAQYLGNQDRGAAKTIFRNALAMSYLISAVFAAASICMPGLLMRLFTDKAVLAGIGRQYLRITGITYLCTAFTQIYMVTLKSDRQVGKSVLFSSTALLLNVFLNGVFIFGFFGIPRLGVLGVAAATLAARLTELCLCLNDWRKNQRIPRAEITDPALIKEQLYVTGPIVLQGLIWGGAMAAMSGIMGRLSPAAVAASSAVSSVQNLATVFSFGAAEAGAILLGNLLGRGELEEAKRNSRTLIKITVSSGILCCMLMLAAEGKVASLLNLRGEAMAYFHMMYKILSVNTVFASITNTILNGIFTAGGDTRFGLYTDGIVMWCICVMAGGISAFILKLPVPAVFAVMNADEVIKTPVSVIRYRKDRWLNNLTEGEGM